MLIHFTKLFVFFFIKFKKNIITNLNQQKKIEKNYIQLICELKGVRNEKKHLTGIYFRNRTGLKMHYEPCLCSNEFACSL